MVTKYGLYHSRQYNEHTLKASSSYFYILQPFYISYNSNMNQAIPSSHILHGWVGFPLSLPVALKCKASRFDVYDICSDI